MNERDLELLDAWRHGEISEDDFRDLEKRLETEPELRAALRALADVEEGLASLALQPLTMGITEDSELRRSPRPLFAYAGWIVAAVVLVASSIWLYTVPNRPPAIVVDDPRPRDVVEVPDAVVTNRVDVKFAEGSDRVNLGESLDGKWVRITAGIVQVEFASGAQLALQGPAELRVDSDMECFLRSGKLTVLAPPEASRFTVKSPTGKVIDLGTEFGLVVDDDGQLDVHVLDGEVEVEVGDRQKRLVENEAATVDPRTRRIETAEIDRTSFDPIRHETLAANKPLRLQFDCGIHAGVYQGTESPAHASGDMALNESYWNGLFGDQSGRFLLADGSVSRMTLEVDHGHSQPKSKSKRGFRWDAEPQLVHATRCRTNGVYDSALGRDRLSGGSMVGLRIKGLPVGRYRVYFIARAVDDGKRGNYLLLKAYRVAVGADLLEVPIDSPTLMPLEDPEARRWVAGQTHHVAEVELTPEDEYLTMLVKRDLDLSPQRGGGGAPIVGVQIVEIAE